jgi:hypothetical protein
MTEGLLLYALSYVLTFFALKDSVEEIILIPIIAIVLCVVALGIGELALL